MRCYIDGNNLAVFIFGKDEKSDVRTKLLNHLLRFKIPKLTTVVFDGFESINETSKGDFNILFSKSRSADQIIIERIKKGDIVVTNDRDLQTKCKFKGGKSISLNDFLIGLKPKVEELEKPLSTSDIDEWMKIFSKREKL